MTYVYQDMTENGYLKVPVTRKQHNTFFPNCEKPLAVRVEYYYHPGHKTLHMEYYYNFWAKFLIITLATIPCIFMLGLPETWRQITDLIYERKRGKFTTNQFWLSRADGSIFPDQLVTQHLKDKLGDKYVTD